MCSVCMSAWALMRGGRGGEEVGSRRLMQPLVGVWRDLASR